MFRFQSAVESVIMLNSFGQLYPIPVTWIFEGTFSFISSILESVSDCGSMCHVGDLTGIVMHCISACVVRLITSSGFVPFPKGRLTAIP